MPAWTASLHSGQVVLLPVIADVAPPWRQVWVPICRYLRELKSSGGRLRRHAVPRCRQLHLGNIGQD